jgi:hypothetical protein
VSDDDDNGQLSFFEQPDERPRARRTDPWTSHEAAASITPKKLVASHLAILDCFDRFGPFHDKLLVVVYERNRKMYRWPPQEDSGIRSRRDELVKRGHLQDSGKTVLIGEGKRKRHAIVWEMV